MKHTALPWTAHIDEGDKYARKYERRWIIPGVGSAFSGADAAMIVKAVNNHERLVQALKISKQYMPSEEDVREKDYAENTDMVRAEVKLVCNLIAELDRN